MAKPATASPADRSRPSRGATDSSRSWTVARGAEKTTEKGVLRGAPDFECLDNAALMVEVTFATGSGTFAVYFPDGTDLTYGRQQIERRGNRYVLPIQAKAHDRARLPGRVRLSLQDGHAALPDPAGQPGRLRVLRALGAA